MMMLSATSLNRDEIAEVSLYTHIKQIYESLKISREKVEKIRSKINDQYEGKSIYEKNNFYRNRIENKENIRKEINGRIKNWMKFHSKREIKYWKGILSEVKCVGYKYICFKKQLRSLMNSEPSNHQYILLIRQLDFVLKRRICHIVWYMKMHRPRLNHEKLDLSSFTIELRQHVDNRNYIDTKLLDLYYVAINISLEITLQIEDH